MTQFSNEDGNAHSSIATTAKGCQGTWYTTLNAITGNIALFRDTKMCLLPGEMASGIDCRKEGGMMFSNWMYMRWVMRSGGGRGETKTVANATHYQGVTPTSLSGSSGAGGVMGFQYRDILIFVLGVSEATKTAITPHMPGHYEADLDSGDSDSEDYQVFSTDSYSPDKHIFYTGPGQADETGNYKTTITVDADTDLIFYADDTTGDLKVYFDYGGPLDECFISFFIIGVASTAVGY